jgi:hypothetical protein
VHGRRRLENAPRKWRLIFCFSPELTPGLLYLLNAGMAKKKPARKAAKKKKPAPKKKASGVIRRGRDGTITFSFGS